jgi:hypothetical protein
MLTALITLFRFAVHIDQSNSYKIIMRKTLLLFFSSERKTQRDYPRVNISRNSKANQLNLLKTGVMF